ncbi:SDR family NAD(P)-dependent oxidoreductase [Halostagnicola kamekurae]|uniref:3-oxoacyl-[acyl-carrier-protein] reductase n=1 Tax=Halostagnicola kamekurae TaxID=619731 RepID=A0A1I6TRP5_9EURY|nr:glucose 1-dehydrogenase [Halostagnicola kamekurae]SFS91933.1 3-oxoacyl-[acyl-carrier-protein] reductase [Halostagnicola kamekurae]
MTVKYDFTGQTAVVTGAAGGIGRGIAELFGECGASVVLADIQEEKLQKTINELRDRNHSVLGVECDITSVEDVRSLVQETLDSFGSIDILVNNAGISSPGGLMDVDLERWGNIIGVNLTGTFNCTREVAPVMIEQGGGNIVNISSMAGRNISHFGGPDYTASKWGIIGLTKHTAWDLSEYGVRANAVCPGPTLTPLSERTATEEDHQEVEEMTALGRWGTPQDQAKAAAFLVSDAASFITGTVLEVDGGASLSSREKNS